MEPRNAELICDNGGRKYGFSINGMGMRITTWHAYRIHDELPIGELMEAYNYSDYRMQYRAYLSDSRFKTFDTLELAFHYLCACAEVAELESLAK